MITLSRFSVVAMTILALSSCWCCVAAHRQSPHHHDHHHHHHHDHENPIAQDRSTNRTDVTAGCGTLDYSPELISRIMQIGERKKSTFQNRIFTPPPSNITIDTYFCVVIDTVSNGEFGDLPDSVLQRQVDVLNANFASSGSLFRFQMKGAQRFTYANGYYTDLNTYIDQVGLACRQGGMDALNIFVVPNIAYDYKTFITTLGITWPYYATGLNYLDGIYILNQAMPGQGFPYEDLGLIAVHEVGHWLGLIHPFQAISPWDTDPCNPSNPNDYIADTPQMASATFGCPVGRDSCPNTPGLDPTNNFMDYTNDYDINGTQCKTTFTPEQVARMQDVWDYYRVQNEICTSDELNVGIQILFDQRPNETSWDITLANGTMVHASTPDALGGTYGLAFAGKSINISFCLSIDNYIFHIYDSEWNGINPPGYFQLSVNGQVISKGGSNLIYIISVPFGSPAPTPAPTLRPTSPPTPIPTSPPSRAVPTNRPTAKPSSRPTVSPTAKPTSRPTTGPPTLKPTSLPTLLPTKSPTSTPTRKPSPLSTPTPSRKPTPFPTSNPTPLPISSPVFKPAALPTSFPTKSPTSPPTAPTPTLKPNTSVPVLTPTQNPTTVNQSLSAPPPSLPSQSPSTKPQTPANQTGAPTFSIPTNQTGPPTSAPSKNTNFTFGTTTNTTAAKTNKTTPVHVNIPAGYCFSEANSVEVEHKGVISIKNLQIGDMVKDATGRMVHVYSFGHYHRTAKTEYLQIYTQALDRPLEISKDHLLFVNGKAVPASSVRLGDQLDFGGTTRATSKVTKIKVVIRSGAYAPFTTSGTIMVNGVAASSYVSLQEGSNVLMLGAYKTPLSMHWLAHVFQSPHRLTCLWRTAYCKSETYTWDGISVWVDGPLHISKWLVRQSGLVLTFLFIPAFSFMLCFYVVELIWSQLFVTLVLVAIHITNSVIKFRKKMKQENRACY